MVDEKQYVPILLTRRGERSALADATAVFEALTPMLSVPPIPWDYEEECPQKSLDDYLAPLPKQLHDVLGDRNAFLDLLWLEDDGPLTGGDHPLVWLTHQANALNLELVPTVSPSRTAAYRAATAQVVARDGRGACVRLPVGEWPSTAGPQLDALLAQLALAPQEVDLMLDLGDETGVLALSALRTELTTLATIKDWRSLIVASGGMPKESPSGQALHIVPRQDWLLYQDLLAGPPALPRRPTFADYVIAHPDPSISDVDPKFMQISGQFRYTAADDWLYGKGPLFKGHGGTGQGGAAMGPVVAALIAHPQFLHGHCSAEAWIAAVKTGQPGSSPETWRRHATAHHLQLVTEQLAILHAP